MENDGSTSTEYLKGYGLVAKVLSKNYPFDLQSGFIVNSGSALPLAGQFVELRDQTSDEMISDALGAERATGYDNRVMELLLDNVNPPVAMCMSGVAFTLGGDRKTFFWSDNSKSGGLRADYRDQTYSAPPVAPGGKSVRARKIKRLFVRSAALENGLVLFHEPKWSFF
jgi:hypothetical protein